MKSRPIATITAFAALTFGIGASAEALHVYSHDRVQHNIALDCADLLNDKPRKISELGRCAGVDSNLFVTLRKTRLYVPGVYIVPTRKSFESEQASMHSDRMQQFWPDVIEFGTIGAGLVEVSALALVGLSKLREQLNAEPTKPQFQTVEK